MRFIIVLSLFSSLWSRFTEIADVNRLKNEAERAYASKQYKTAAEKYTILIRTYNSKDERIRMNLAHSWYLLHDSVNAEFHYKKLSQSANLKLNSVSNQQLGMLSASHKEYQQALQYFRLALKADPGNESARYNYELISKKLDQQKKKTPDKNKQDEGGMMMENDDSPNGRGNTSSGRHDDEGRSGESEQLIRDKNGDRQRTKGLGRKNKSLDHSAPGEENDENSGGKNKKKTNPLVSQRLKLMNMSQERAEMILDAMKNSEIQYLQQLKKKGNPKYDKDKPDW
ncbi:MAG: tetratricopeptide repeat protein [Cytophagaceae bacterium]